MRKLTTIVVAFLISLQGVFAQHEVVIRINDLPPYHIAGSDVFLAGTFNGWNPSDTKYQFNVVEGKGYSIKLNLPEGEHWYKITRGGWDKVECLRGGAGMGNRQLLVPADTTIDITVEEWVDKFPPKPVVHTSSKQVHLLDSAFNFRQLKRKGVIWIYLPEDYDETTKRYPVLYMHDGQNLFDDANSFSGEWGVDEFLDTTIREKCIVVGIAHGGDKRLVEYNPFNHEKFGKGRGKKYAKFLKRTLKPYIDRNYRTKSDKQNTYIAGSSMGGLISMYAALKYPRTFGGVGVFSPAFWVSGPEIYKVMQRKGKKLDSKIYFYGGKLEGDSMIPDLMRAFDVMRSNSSSELKLVIRDEGEHNERRWREEFPLFYEWVFSN